MPTYPHKLKTCNGCGEPKVIWKSDGRMKFCKDCWYKKLRDQPAAVPPSRPSRLTRIKPVSDKQSRLNAAYAKLREIFFGDPKNHSCKAGIYGCTGEATDVHHKKGRGIYMLDISTWLPVCRSCHHWIETHPQEAKQLGFSESRLNVNSDESTSELPTRTQPSHTFFDAEETCHREELGNGASMD